MSLRKQRISTQIGVKNDYVVEVADILPILEPLIKQLDRDLDADDKARFPRKDGATTNGACGVLSARVAHILGFDEESPARRIYDIRYRKVIKTSYTLVEAMFTALGHHVSHFDFPIFPSCTQLCREITDVWCEDLSLEERKKFAKSLFHFVQGYFSAERAMEPFANEVDPDFGEGDTDTEEDDRFRRKIETDDDRELVAA